MILFESGPIYAVKSLQYFRNRERYTSDQQVSTMQSSGPGYLLHHDTRQLQESSHGVELSTEISPFATNFKTYCWDFPGSSLVKNPSASAECTGLIPEPGRFHIPESN